MGKFSTGFVLGALTGAVVAYLFTPEPLEEVKQTVVEKQSEIMDRIPDQAKTRAQELKEEALQRAKEAAKEAKDRLPEHIEKVRKLREDILTGQSETEEED